MTEVPDYLLQRSRGRRAALGLGGDEEGGALAASGDAGGDAPATTSAASGSSSAGLRDSGNHGCFSRPMPCSADTDPPRDASGS